MMSLAQAAGVLGGRVIGGDAEFTAVSSDSRSIAPGELFVALRGDNFDGAKFVVDAAKGGAVAALVNADSVSADAPCPQLLVEDTRLALGRLASYWRKQFSVQVVGITGSNGKTTTKEMLASILREYTKEDLLVRPLSLGEKVEVMGGTEDTNERVLSTQGNLNNDIGLPLTLLKLRSSHRYAVIEMGMNHTGEIDYLTHIAAPDVALITNAGSAHLAGLGTVEAVAQAKGEIFSGLGAQGVAVINADDEHADVWRAMAQGRSMLMFGLAYQADIRASWQTLDYGSRIEVHIPQAVFSADLQVPGQHNVCNALAATAAAIALNVPLSAISNGLGKFAGVAGRLQRKAALRGAVLLDDTYNANPASLHAALEVLAGVQGQKILVLGDMGELGADAAHFHAEIGAEAQQLGIHTLLALGDLSAYAVDEFGDGATHFKRIEDLLESLEQHLDIGSTVLVKGSRFMKMERVVQYCTALQ